MRTIFYLLFVLGVSEGRTRGRQVCDMDCRNKMAPVCGSDGIIYTSRCDLKRINCGQGVFTVDSSKCQRSRGASCQHRCANSYDPVCGSDGRTYLNNCILRVEECRSGTSFAHYGPCVGSTNMTLECPSSCEGRKAREGGPICGSDGNVYTSTCDLRLRTCGQKVVSTSHMHCQTTQRCKDICPFSYKAVCGSDGRIYNSKCQMKVKNCGKHIFETPMVHCRPQERTTGGCPISCEGVKNSPVCGSNGRLYDSECDMERLNCGLGGAGRVFPVSLEKCRKKMDSCERIQCPFTLDPVCGTDSSTYINYCHLHKATCKKGVELAHYGHCPDMSVIENCEAECSDEQEEQYPVCGSDGNVYQSNCDMHSRTCGQKVVAVALHHCEATKHCVVECKKDNVAVCSSDNKMYRNKCEMKVKNCGRHVYEVPIKKCLAGFKFLSCLRFCPKTFEPVCGTDGMTYSNDCFLKMENCRARSLGRSFVTRTYHGKCGYPQPQPKLYMFR
uniref:Agrin-like n=1 Tax=Hirondellea gigas TaxID=1518452 RepID=A0A2P2HX35_9CRUS